MKFVIVTNNPKVRDELGQEFDVDYADITYREILYVSSIMKVHIFCVS